MLKHLLTWLFPERTECLICHKPGQPGDDGHEECYEIWAIR